MLVLAVLAVFCPPLVHLEDSEDPVIEWLASPAELPVIERRALPIEPPETPRLPLWDLEASRARLPELTDEPGVGWAAWAVAAAQGRDASAHAAVVVALRSDELRPEHVLWWRSQASIIDVRDALLDTIEIDFVSHTSLVLTAALALAQWEVSCPVEVGPDGACRMPGSSIGLASDRLLQRDPIAVARARQWTKVALGLRDRAEPDNPALVELLTELELVSTLEGYEALLGARSPEDISVEVDYWKKHSGEAKWEREYARQVHRQAESIERLRGFLVAYGEDVEALSNSHAQAMQGPASVVTLALLREAKLALAVHTTISNTGPRDARAQRRLDREQPNRTPVGCPSENDLWRDAAQRSLERCVEIGGTIGGRAEVVEACHELLEVLDPIAHPPPNELVPAPQSRSTMQRAGVVSL